MVTDSLDVNRIVYDILKKQEEALFTSLELLKQDEKYSYIRKLRQNIDSLLQHDEEKFDDKLSTPDPLRF